MKTESSKRSEDDGSLIGCKMRGLHHFTTLDNFGRSSGMLGLVALTAYASIRRVINTIMNEALSYLHSVLELTFPVLRLHRMSVHCTGFRGCHRSMHRVPNFIHQTKIRALSTSKPLMAQPAVVRASFTERARGKLSQQKLQIAVRQIHHDGLVVIQDAVNTDLLDKLNDRMVADALDLRSRGKDSPFNYNPGNLQQDAPPVKEFFHPEIFLSLSELAPAHRSS